MDRIYSEASEEKDFTDGTIKRRISSILKAPRTPLQDLGSGNELIQDCNIEKRQRNSRRVSFADTIRVFPPDPQITVELKHAETVGELRDQDLFNENEDPEVVSCEITGMNTLLHAPIQTSLQQTECDGESGQEWKKMDRTLVFSEENEMDMTSGHTIMITHDIRVCQETDKTRKIDFKSFSADLKSEKEASQMNEFSFFTGSTKVKDTSLSQQKLNTENTPKINFGDFLKSLKSTVDSLPSGIPKRNVCSSQENVSSHLHEESTASGVLHDNRQKPVSSILSNRSAVTFASKQLACEQENVGMITTNTESVLTSGISSFNMVNSQENLWMDCPVSYNVENSRLKTSRGQLGVQEDQSMCVNDITVNDRQSIANKNHIKTKEDASLACYYKSNIMPVPIGSVTSMPVFHADKTTLSSFSADMELTRNCTGLVLEENSKEIGYLIHEDLEKPRNNVSKLIDGTIFQEEHMDITKNQVPANSYLNRAQHSIFNEKAVLTQEVTYDKMGLLDPRIQSGPQTSYFSERKKTNCCLGDETSRAASLFCLKNSNLNSSQIANSSGSQAENQFLSLSDDIMQQVHRTAGENKINKKSRLSNSGVSLRSEGKTATFHFSENIEITKPITYFKNSSLSAAGFQAIPPQGIESDKENVRSSSNKTIVFSQCESNEMEINKSYIPPVNYGMQQCKRTPQAHYVQSVDGSVYMYNDMDETKAITGILDQIIENSSSQSTQKQSNESERMILAGSAKDRTVIFSLSDENEMEITQSHTVALKHDVVTKGKDIPISSTLFSNKTSMFTVGEDMEVTNPVEYVTEKSLKNVADSFAMPDQNTRPGKKGVIGSASEETGPALTEISDMSLTKNFTVAVEGAPQVLSQIPTEKPDMSRHSSDITISKSVPFVPAEKTMLFMNNSDMEITKSITYTSSKDTSVKGLQMEKEEIGNVILPGKAKEETVVYLHKDNEMEITRAHTVAVNHDILQQVKVAAQGLALGSVDKSNVHADLGDAATQSKTFVPADKTFMYNNDMEITKPLSDTFLENSCFSALSQKRKATGKTTLPRSDKDDTTICSQHDAEMETTKCHTVAVTHGIVSHCEKTSQVLFYQDKMDTTGSHTVAKENMYKSVKLGKLAESVPFSNQMIADDVVFSKRHTITLDNKTDLPCKPTIQAKLPLPVSTTCTVTSYQDNSTTVTNLLANATNNGNLEGTEKKEMSNESIKQSMNKVLSHTCGGKIQDVEISKNHTISTYDPNNDVPGGEKDILNSFTKSKEKTVVFSDGNTMEMTRNYTTGIEFMHMNVNNECHLNSEGKFSSGFPALVNTYGSKLDTAKTEQGPSETSMCPASMMLPICLDAELENEDYLKIKENQPDLCTSNITNFAQELTLNIVSNKGEDFMFTTMDSKSSKEIIFGFNKEKMPILVSETESLKNDPRKLYQAEQEARSSGETDAFLFDDKVRKKYEKEPCEWASITKDWQNNLESPPINTFSSEKEPVLLSELPGVDNSCPKLKDTEKKSELVLLTQEVSSLGDILPKLTVKPDDFLSFKEDLKKEMGIVASTEWTDTGFTEGASANILLNTMSTESCNIKKLPLGVFPPKLPNKRSTFSNAEGATARMEEKRETQDSEISVLIKKSSDKITQSSSPSCYIDEELLPAYVGEMDSNESLSCDIPEKVYNVRQNKGISDNEGCLSEGFETNKRQRALNPGDEELQKEKKFKADDGWIDTADLKQPLCSTVIADNHGETQEGKNVPELMAVNLEKTQSSNSSSLDSVQRNSEMETQLLMDSISEQNLREKLQEGTITVREFFTLLEVHVLIQKPRQSQLPPKYEINTAPTLEDEITSQYVYRPKLLAYDEDCQALYKIIEELKVHAGDQDKLLVNVHKSLWEVMRTCSDEELKGFGAELNKMKSCFTKKSKVLAHKGKAKLYAKLVQDAQLQWEKLQSRLAEIDELLREMDGCIKDLETETAALEESELDVNDVVSEYESKVRDTERELENLRVQEEAFQRDQSNLRDKKEQMVSEIKQLQEYASSCQEITEKYDFSEWVMKEWNDHQAVFTFLYDSVELVVGLECPVDGAIYSNKIVSVNFESLLDEAKALPSSKLVHRLIFEFINSQSSWQEKCLTVNQLSQMLRDISLVVSRCQLLGEEIEFLNRWGGKFYLLKTEVNDTKVKFLFSSSVACAKFEVEISLSANYPASPVTFTIQECTGNLSQEEISMVLSSVPAGANYLRRIVKQISHNLLQCSPSTIHKQQKVAVR